MNSAIKLKEIIRWAIRHKGSTALSISGMAIGIAVALIIGIWSLNEFSFDKYHKDASHIYRVCRQGLINNESVVLGSDFGPVGTISKQQFPDVEDMTRIRVMSRELVKINGITSYEDQICTVDKNLFTFFTFKLETGDPSSCLDGPDKIIIDRYLADKYFNNGEVVGQIVDIYGKKFTISAVMQNVPENSHLKFRIVIPFSGLNWLGENTWGNNDNFLTYLKLKQNADPASIASQITPMTYEHFPLYKQFKIKHFLQPLTDIHFSPGFRFDYVITNDNRIVFIFISLAILILLIASFNFINLFVSNSIQRAKSIGIKKINGSSKASLFMASYLETILYIMAATLIAFILVVLLFPFFNQLTGSNLRLDISNINTLVYTAILIFGTITIVGSIPAMHVLRFNPEQIIHNRFKGKNISLLQQVLVISQFVASIVLISSAIVVQRQIHFVQNHDLGFNKEHIIYFDAKNFGGKYEAFREELIKSPSIIDVTAKSILPSQWNNGATIAALDNPGNQQLMETCQITYNYPDVIQIPIAEGKNPFDPMLKTSNECLINEQAVKSLNLTDPIGKQIKVHDRDIYTIAGVLKNANTKSLHIQIDPQVYVSLARVEPYHVIMVKTSEDQKSAVDALKALWSKYNEEYPMEYYFLDDAYDKLYKIEETASKIIGTGMIIALFLAFMGLYAISTYATERRVKEIGVRKVNGATIHEVMVMLNHVFVKWVAIAFVIATPLAWYAVHKWLQNFAYKTSLGWWIFALAGVLALAISLLTVSWQSWKAATRNPVEALRYE
ncbi:MAG TPA: ABC transporter permease [Prolixibacteraceae bacterium]|nr:ABC transporter permease [Prolixibacteraceae bacterium]